MHYHGSHHIIMATTTLSRTPTNITRGTTCIIVAHTSHVMATTWPPPLITIAISNTLSHVVARVLQEVSFEHAKVPCPLNDTAVVCGLEVLRYLPGVCLH